MGTLFAMTFLFGLGCGVTIGILQTAHAQTLYSPTNATVQVPITVPTLQFQPAIPNEPPLPPPQNQGTNEVLISIVTTAIGVLLGKYHSDKKTSNLSEIVKDTVVEVLKGKVVDKELARVYYNGNPDQAQKITDAPDVKLGTLTKDVQDYSEKVVKEKTP